MAYVSFILVMASCVRSGKVVGWGKNRSCTGLETKSLLGQHTFAMRAEMLKITAKGSDPVSIKGNKLNSICPCA
jgi:hypothetical protein